MGLRISGSSERRMLWLLQAYIVEVGGKAGIVERFCFQHALCACLVGATCCLLLLLLMFLLLG